jgi:hypothetical protein
VIDVADNYDAHPLLLFGRSGGHSRGRELG